MDPTIPRGRRTPPALGPSIGRLIWQATNMVILAEDAGSNWPPGAYSIAQGFADGISALPRPWVYNTETGAVIVEGDMVLIDFLRGNPRCPVVRGVVRKTNNADADLAYDYRAGNIGNARNLVIRYVDLEGTEKGSVRVKTLEADGSVEITVTQGSVTIDVDGDVSLEVGGDLDVEVTGNATIKASGTLVLDGSSIQVGDNAVEPIPLGTSLTTWLATHTHPYIDTPAGASVTSPPAAPTTGLLSTTVTVKG